MAYTNFPANTENNHEGGLEGGGLHRKNKKRGEKEDWAFPSANILSGLAAEFTLPCKVSGGEKVTWRTPPLEMCELKDSCGRKLNQKRTPGIKGGTKGNT